MDGKIDRISSIDALRGFSLLGIIIANLPFDSSAIHGSYDEVSAFIFHFFIDKKFITIFSILFGFGFYVQMQNAKSAGYQFNKYFFFRMILLFIIGCLHAYLLWFGDIVRSFAFGGLVLLLFYRFSVKKLMIISVFFTIIATGTVFIGNAALGWQEYSYDLSIAGRLPYVKSYPEYLAINFRIDPWVNFIQDMPLTLSFTLGNILIGYVFGKTGYLVKPDNHRRMSNLFIITGATAGFVASYLYYLIVRGKIELEMSLIWLPYFLVFGMVMQSLLYITVFLRLYRSGIFRNFLKLFEPVGKMALSNYILQSVFYILFFFHFVPILQLFGKLTITSTFLIGILLYGLQVLLSLLWLNYYEQGPAEKLWKRLSYRYGERTIRERDMKN